MYRVFSSVTIEACKRQHVPAAQVLRDYMREFVKAHPKVRKPKLKSETA